MSTIRSILSRLPRTDLDRGIEVESLKRRAWNEHATVVISVQDPRLTWVEREQLQQLASRLYGRSARLRARNPQPRLVNE